MSTATVLPLAAEPALALAPEADPKPSARKRGRRPASALQPTSTRSSSASQLEQEVVDLKAQLTDRDHDLAAARTTNRELMVQLNATRPAPH
jgi:hypothetical protein